MRGRASSVEGTSSGRTVVLRLSDGGLGGTLEERSTAMPSGTLVGGTGAPEPVTDWLDPPNQDTALDLLRRLNALADRDGHAFTGRVRYHGYEPWWFHQEAVFHRYLLPYTRYQRLITRLASADRIVADDCPPDLSTLLRLTLDSRCDLRLRESPPSRHITILQDHTQPVRSARRPLAVLSVAPRILGVTGPIPPQSQPALSLLKQHTTLNQVINNLRFISPNFLRNFA